MAMSADVSAKQTLQQTHVDAIDKKNVGLIIPHRAGG